VRGVRGGGEEAGWGKMGRVSRGNERESGGVGLLSSAVR